MSMDASVSTKGLSKRPWCIECEDWFTKQTIKVMEFDHNDSGILQEATGGADERLHRHTSFNIDLKQKI